MALKRQSDKIEHLAEVPLFQGLRKKDLIAITRVADEIAVDAGVTLVSQDDRGDAAYVIVSGTAVVRRNGRKITELGPGDVVGELSLIDGGHRTATVVMSEPGSVLEIPRRDFSGLLDGSQTMTRRILEQVAGRLRETDSKLYG